jgi:hypothetical protein
VPVTSQADLALSRELSTKAKLAEVIFGRQRPPRAVMCRWHHGFHFLQRQRIFEFKAASHAFGDPSGVVPDVIGGGRGLISLKSTGGEEGPSFLLAHLSSVLSINVEDPFGKTACKRGLFVTFTAIRASSPFKKKKKQASRMWWRRRAHSVLVEMANTMKYRCYSL